MIKETKNPSGRQYSKRIEYFEDGESIGFLDFSLIYERIEIDNILVNEKNRNKHIGTQLMEYLIKIAKENKAINITLEVRESNTVAIHLYEKMGFIKVAIRKFYYGNEDAILMEKKVM